MKMTILRKFAPVVYQKQIFPRIISTCAAGQERRKLWLRLQLPEKI